MLDAIVKVLRAYFISKLDDSFRIKFENNSYLVEFPDSDNKDAFLFLIRELKPIVIQCVTCFFDDLERKVSRDTNEIEL